MPNFNKEQQQAIDSRDANVLVSASAGSGKTAVLVERIVERVIDKDNPLNIDEFLVVTFTKAAARQMKEKIADKLSKYAAEYPENSHIVKQLSLVNKADITTIDSFCLKVVKENFYLLGIDSSFSIIDEKLMDILKDDVLDKIFEEEYERLLQAPSSFDEENNQEFGLLLDIFGKTNDDSELRKIILKCVKQAEGCSVPETWYEEARKSVSATTISELNDTVWMKKYLDSLRKEAIDVKSRVLMAKAITERPEGCGRCGEVVRDEIRVLDGIIGAAGYEEVYQSAFSEMQKLVAVRKEGPEKDNYVEFKAIRDTYAKYIPNLRKKLIDSSKILEETALLQKLVGKVIELCKEFTRRLAEEKAKKKQYEFSDIAHMALKVVFAGHDENGYAIPTKTGRVIADRYKEIYIDEYQDSNFIQEDILTSCSRVTGGEYNIFMVGDVKQSIYRFRQARPELFTEKYDTYEESELDDKENRLIILKNNYRSREHVLSGINSIFKHIMHKDMGGIEYDEKAFLVCGKEYEKADGNISTDTEVYIVTKRPEENQNTQYQEDDDQEDTEKLLYEAKLVADRIKSLTDKESGLDIWDEDKSVYRKATYRDCMILLRGIKGRGKIIADALTDNGIPVALDNPNGYFDALEVTTLLSMLKVIDNSRQDIPLAAVLISELAGLNESRMVLISEMLKDNKKALLYDKCQYFILEFEDSDDDYRRETAELLKDFFEKLDSWKKERPYLSIAMLIKKILDDTKYDLYISGLPDGKRRVANIHMLIEKAMEFEKGEFRGLFNFLRYMEKIRIHDIDFGEAMMISESENVIRITTMHKSKGLEYPVCILMGMGIGFNTMYVKDTITIDSDYHISMKYFDLEKRVKRKSGMQKIIHNLISIDNLSEEQRILYVAMTRAKEKLIMVGTIGSEDDIKEEINYRTRSSAKNYYDWVLPAVRRESASGLYSETIVYPDEIDLNSAISQYGKKESYDKLKEIFGGVKQDKITEIEKLYNYEYPYQKIAAQKSKMSVSEIKKTKMFFSKADKEQKRDKDIKKLLPESGSKGAARGTVIHKIMELMPFTAINSKEEFIKKVDELLTLPCFTEEERHINKIEAVYDFYDSELFERLKKADAEKKLFREKRYTMGYYPAEVFKDKYDEDNPFENGDMIVVQGEIDVYFIEGDKAILLDYKTDSVNNGDELIKRYYAQLECYKDAIKKLTGLPVTEKLIYSFKTGETIDVTEEALIRLGIKE